ncbi:hypothetical protein ABLN87_15130 [Ruegeria sp. SCPT10]|uniref:hypothetical protein n=1 Tax=Ruegeria sp. SCP10 TaxID=3141377 RepID=UPI00333D8B13
MCDFVRLSFAEQEELTVVKRDGAKVDYPSPFDLIALAETDATEVNLALPSRALKKISVLATAAADLTGASIEWLALQTDIAIWCTHDFDHTDQRVWAQMPNRLKDHAILVSINSGRERDETEARLCAEFGSEFLDFVCLSPEDASQARSGSSLDKILFRASGGHKLISILRRDIDAAREHATGQAELFLQGAVGLLGPDDASIEDARNTVTDPTRPVEEPTPAASPIPDAIPAPNLDDAINKLSRLSDSPALGNVFSNSEFLTEMAKILEEIELDLDAWSDDVNMRGSFQMLRELADLVELFRIEAERADVTETIMAAIQLKRELSRAKNSKNANDAPI